MISPRENFFRMMRRESPQRLPLHLNLTPPLVEQLKQRTGSSDWVSALDLDVRPVGVCVARDEQKWRDAYARLGFNLPADSTVGYCGITHRTPSAESLGDAWHLKEMLHPLEIVQSVEQLEALPWPVLDGGDEKRVAESVQRAHKEGRVSVCALECTFFESAWYLRGMDNLFMDLAEENPIADWLMDWFTARAVRGVEIACDADTDVIGLGDDVGTQRGMMMSVDFWRQHMRPRLARIIQAIRSRQKRHVYVRYHSDGDIRDVIDDLIEIGVDLINPMQPECMPLEEVIPKYQARVGFWGMIGTQTLMPFGTPEQIRAFVQQLADFANAGARIVAAPTHVLEPDVPWSNIEALVDAIKHQTLR